MSRRRPLRAVPPRLVTKAEPSAERRATEASRWAYDTTAPHPAAQADALGATVLAYLITGPILFGGIGWLLDRWMGTSLLVAVGALAGMALSLYTIWLRYGSPVPGAAGQEPRAGADDHDEENP